MKATLEIEACPMNKLRKDLEALQEAVLALRPGAKTAGNANHVGDKASDGAMQFFQKHIDELNAVLRQLRDQTEVAAEGHPVAAIASALALGFAIGRLTAR